MVGGQGIDHRESQRENTMPSRCLAHPVITRRRTSRCDTDVSFNTSPVLSNLRLDKREWGKEGPKREREREREREAMLYG